MSAHDDQPLTTTEAGRLLGLTDGRVRQLIIAGDLPATRFGSAWVVRRQDAERWRKTRPPLGRPASKH